MLMRFDPFRELDRLAQPSRFASMPLDAYREGDHFVVNLDLPGVDPESIDLTVEKNVLTVSAERSWNVGDEITWVANERPQGTFSRQLFLGESLDTDGIEAGYDRGVLTIRVPVAEAAKPRKVQITSGGQGKAEPIEATSSAA
ncbi:MAG: Hsp20/alpha crystallin family protein [Acidimicrobiales bacterium]